MRKARGRHKLAYYECVFIARQDISATQVEGLCETFTKIIADNGGSIANTENWGLRTLSYRINKNRKAHYVMFNIDAPAAAIHEMERQMRINEDVLRYLTIKVDAFEEGPSVMMQSRQRDDRPRRYDNDRPSETKSDDAAAPAPAAAVSAPETSETASEGAEA
jgi:small subunit ribosomal protein S6